MEPYRARGPALQRLDRLGLLWSRLEDHRLEVRVPSDFTFRYFEAHRGPAGPQR